MTELRAFKQGITKEQFVNELKAHQKADRFIKGTYWNWENGKGCAVGCSIESISRLNPSLRLMSNEFNCHKVYEQSIGVPEWLAILEDVIFEELSLERSKKWPVEFGEAINEGSELDKIKVPFIVFILENCLESLSRCKFDEDSFPDVKNALDQSKDVVNQMIKAQKTGVGIESAARSARSAWSVAASARSAARSARSARSAARSAWYTAESVAWSARYAAWSAWYTAESVAAAESAKSAAYEKYADKLLELMRGCKYSQPSP